MITSPHIALVGCPEKDVGSVESSFGLSSIPLRPKGTIENGDKVVFCISACYGPSAGTRKSVESLFGRSIVPIAIVLAYADMATDDSLRELVNCEERCLLMKILPENIVNSLPVLLDVDPNLVTKIVVLAQNTINEVRCSSSS